MNIFQAMILGLVQGLTEFLPVSSSGHLILFEHLLGIEEISPSYDIILHMATLIPVCIILKDELISLIKNPFQKTMYLLIIATIPAVIIGGLFGGTIDAVFATGVFLGGAFLVTGFILLYADYISEKLVNKKDELSYMDSLLVGIAQGIAIIPGISRSGSTLAALLSTGVNREKAARFSFLMSIPAILGGFVLEVFKVATGREPFVFDFLPMFAGFLVASISGYIAINYLLVVIKEGKLRYFSYYLFSISALVMMNKYILHWVM